MSLKYEPASEPQLEAFSKVVGTLTQRAASKGKPSTLNPKL